MKDSADAPKLYAWKIARECNGEPFCIEVPKGACPTVIDDNRTAPDPSTLVRDRVLRFR